MKMSIDLILNFVTMIAAMLTASSLFVAIEKVLKNRKIKLIKKEQKEINEEIARNEAKIEDLLNELIKIKNEIGEIPDDEISKDDRKKLESLIDKILEKQISD